MLETLAFVTVVVTHGVDGLPAGTEFKTNDPVRCLEMGKFIVAIESLGARADGFCDYTFAPARSIRPKARPENLGE